jgi:L-fuculose-phosphate aldolase
MTDRRRLRQDVIAAARAMLARGLVVSTAGNVSARSGDGLLITPTRRYPDDLVASDLVELDTCGVLRGATGQPSLEWPLHAAIYLARPDVHAIVHTHSPHATARSFDPEPLLVEREERGYFAIDRIDVAAAAEAGSPQLARAAVQALGSAPVALLARHGVIGTGATPRDALEMCCLAEHQAIIEGLRRASLTPHA